MTIQLHRAAKMAAELSGIIRRLMTLTLPLICLSLAMTQAAFALQGVSTGELVKTSELIVSGKVEKISSHWVKDKSLVVTRATVKIKEVMAGNIGRKDIIVEYEGGKVGDLELKLTDAVSLSQGEEVILFLHQAQSALSGTVYVITCGAQGKYAIKNGNASKGGFTIDANHDVVDNNIAIEDLTAKIKASQ
ncbi:MAG: hypothetical protein L7F77_07800 [Candidatus Magnetominusculus sp. LBB02]|nr:hypothetical protein [Candidatus Magnetominusculus sp. LBB02]